MMIDRRKKDDRQIEERKMIDRQIDRQKKER